eukprot:m.662764 g.662764  ORF g.662764 m.662764 type:complete len:818 (-) comp58478_c0_seq7:67-2520(-)
MRAFVQTVAESTAVHEAPTVRQALIELCYQSLSSSACALSASVPVLLNGMVGLCTDSFPQVSALARERLDSFCGAQLSKTSERTDSSLALQQVLHDNVRLLSLQLPRVIRGVDDVEKLRLFSLLSGYFSILGPQTESFLALEANMKRLSSCLMQILQLEESDMGLIQERPGSHGKYIYTGGTPLSPPSPTNQPATPSANQTATPPTNSTASQSTDQTAGQSFEPSTKDSATAQEAQDSSDPAANASAQDSTVQTENAVETLGNLFWNAPYRKRFAFFHDERIFASVRQTLRLIGYFGDITVLVDYFLRLFRQSPREQKQALIVLNELLLGASGHHPRVFSSTHFDQSNATRPLKQKNAINFVVREIFHELLREQYWTLRTSNDHNDAHTTTVRAASTLDLRLDQPTTFQLPHLYSNIILSSLVIEAVATIAFVLQRDFQRLIMHSIYQLLRLLGSHNAVVANTALFSLTTICNACAYDSPSELIQRNCDYLINAISLNLRHLELNGDAPRVLQVMVQYLDESSFPLLSDIINEVVQALDGYDQRQVPSLLSVLHTLSAKLSDWRASLDLQHKEKEERLRSSQHSELQDAKEPDPASHHVLLSKVLERCIHFVGHDDARVRLLVMDTIGSSALALTNETLLLPLIHQLWKPLTQRLKDPEGFVVRQAVLLIAKLAELCPRFIQNRVLTDVIPPIVRFLHHDPNLLSRQRHTWEWRPFASVLSALASLVRVLELGLEEIQLLSDACFPFLPANYPQPLQEGALEVMRGLIERDSDAMWYEVSMRCGGCGVERGAPFVRPRPPPPHPLQLPARALLALIK